jgi:hypothetical protein
VTWAKILDAVGIKQKKSLDLERGMWHHGMKGVSCVSGLDGTPQKTRRYDMMRKMECV